MNTKNPTEGQDRKQIINAIQSKLRSGRKKWHRG